MPARKVRVELFDEDGDRYTISFEGQITRDKAVRLLDLVELLGGVPSKAGGTMLNGGVMGNDLSKYDRVRMIVQKHFPLVWFSSKELQSAYERELKETIGLSTAATYLSRLAGKGLLVKAGASNSLKYKLAQGFPKARLEQQMR